MKKKKKKEQVWIALVTYLAHDGFCLIGSSHGEGIQQEGVPHLLKGYTHM